MNKYIIATVFLVLLVAMAGAASASVTVKVDTVQTNGHYVGHSVLLPGEIYHWGYNYTIVPDGTFTISGTITNNDAANSTNVLMSIGTIAQPLSSNTYNVPAGGKVSFSLTCASDSVHDLAAGYQWPITTGYHMVDVTKADYVMQSDTTTHTINEGPMSDAVAVYASGKLTYNGQPVYTIGLIP